MLIVYRYHLGIWVGIIIIFFDTEACCIALTGLELTLKTRLGLNSQRRTALSAGVEGVLQAPCLFGILLFDVYTELELLDRVVILF